MSIDESPEQRQKKLKFNFDNSLKILRNVIREKGFLTEKTNDKCRHTQIFHGGEKIFDYWASTGLFINVKTKKRGEEY